MGTNLASSMGDVGFDEDDEEWDVEVHGHVEVPCCSGLCYDKLAGGAAGVMLTSLLILILWYMAMSMCAVLVTGNDPATGLPGINMFAMTLVWITSAWICLRICFGPGDDQFRASSIMLMGIWGLWMANKYFGGTPVSPMGCEFEVAMAADPDAADDV